MSLPSNKTLHTRAEMVRVLLRAGQFAHLTEADFNRSLTSLWNIDDRLAWIDEGSTAYHRATWAERAVSIGLVKAAETGLMVPDYFDVQAVDWVARTEPTLCCLCLEISDPFKGCYDIPLAFAKFVCPAFEVVAAPYYVRRPFCGACSWMIGSGVRTDADLRFNSAVSLNDRLPPGDDLWTSILARMINNRKFRDRVHERRANVRKLRFDPRRAPELVAA